MSAAPIQQDVEVSFSGPVEYQAYLHAPAALQELIYRQAAALATSEARVAELQETLAQAVPVMEHYFDRAEAAIDAMLLKGDKP